MKKLSIMGIIAGAMFGAAANAADITIYYSPTCPHCHHARDFISNTLIYEYPDLRVTTVNVMESANRPEFTDALKKCEYESGGVPVLVIGEKCFQGYADSMADDLRTAIEVDMDDAAKSVAAENKKSLAADADAFKKAHEDRLTAIVEREIVATDDAAQKKNNAVTPAKKSDSGWVFYVILVALVLGLGFVLTRKGNKK